MTRDTITQFCIVSILAGWFVQPVLALQIFTEGTGEPNNPYQIATAKQLVAIGHDPNLASKHYVLVNDIDFDPNQPDGLVFQNSLIQTFSGVLDGQGYTIENLYIQAEQGAGLFGSLRGVVKALFLKDVVLSGESCGGIAVYNQYGTILDCQVTGCISCTYYGGGVVGFNDGYLVECKAEVKVAGADSVGGLVGVYQKGALIHCEVQGEITGAQYIGGLVGRMSKMLPVPCLIIECRTNEGTLVNGIDHVGGLVGSQEQGTIIKSSSCAQVVSEQTAGGLVGHADGKGLLIQDCYVQGKINGVIAGALIGEIRYDGCQIVNCWTACEFIAPHSEDHTVCGLVGSLQCSSLGDNIVISSFWDMDVAGVDVSQVSDSLYLGTGLTSAQMQNPQTFQDAGWDLTSIWQGQEGQYLQLKWNTP